MLSLSGRDNIMIRTTIRSTAFVLMISLPACELRPETILQQSGRASTQTAFDVSLVKPSDPNSTGFSMRPTPDNFSMSGATLKFLIQYAYDLHDFQVEGGPEWMKSEKFDVKGKMDHPSEGTQDREAGNKLVQLRLQTLLTERFNLRVHRSIKELPVYGLVVAKGGPKLEMGKANEGYSTASGMYKCSYSSMSDLAWLLSGPLNRTVVDETNLVGPFAFTLKWTPDEVTTQNATVPGLFTAIQEQLGLKLIPHKGPVPIVIVDRVNRPSSN